MCSKWGLLALAPRTDSSKDNSVCLSRCAFPLQVGLLRGTTQKQLPDLFQASAGIGQEDQRGKEEQQELCPVLGRNRSRNQPAAVFVSGAVPD